MGAIVTFSAYRRSQGDASSRAVTGELRASPQGNKGMTGQGEGGSSSASHGWNWKGRRFILTLIGAPIALFVGLAVLVPLLDPKGWEEAKAAHKAKQEEELRHPGAKAAAAKAKLMSDERDSIAEREAARDASEKEERDRLVELEAIKRSGFGCLSSDGSNPSTIREVKELLRDPASFEHIKTQIYPSIHGEHALWMRYRARNGFGGMNVETVQARIAAKTCQATLTSDPQSDE